MPMETITIPCKQFTTKPACLGGGKEPPGHPHFNNSPPRPIATPLEEKKHKITKHIRDDALKDIVFQMHRGDFVAKLEYVKTDDGNEILTGHFGASSPCMAPYDSEFLIGEVIEGGIFTEKIDEHRYEGGYSAKKTTIHSNKDFTAGLGTEYEQGFLLRLWHHALRHHASSLSNDAVSVALHHVLCHYDFGGDKMEKALIDTVVIAADCILPRTDFSHNFVMSSNFDAIGEKLESKGLFAAAAAIYDVATRLAVGGQPSVLATLNQHVGLAHKRNGQFELSEASYIMALKYRAISNGNALDFQDRVTKGYFGQLIDLYAALGKSNEDMRVEQAVNAILSAGGYPPRDTTFDYQKFLKGKYRGTLKVRQLFSRAVLSGKTNAFRDICLSAKGDSVAWKTLRSTTQTAEQRRQRDIENASRTLQTSSYQLMAPIARCTHCGKIHRDDGDCVLKRCPCRAVAYCSEDCQRAHWPEHKTLCVKNKKPASNA